MTSILEYITSLPKELVKYISLALGTYHINGVSELASAGLKSGLSLTSS